MTAGGFMKKSEDDSGPEKIEGFDFFSRDN